jgi:hypothetical protein
MASTNDDGASPCAASVRCSDRCRPGALLAAAALSVSLGARPATLAAQEYYNLDAGRPTRVEDATPTPRQELDIQMPALRVDQIAGGPKIWRADSKLSYGVAALTEVELRVPLLLIDPPDVRMPRTIGVGGLGIGAARALTIETAALPAFALAGEWVAPVGSLSARTGSFGAKLLATKTFSLARVNLNVGMGTWSLRAASLSPSSGCPSSATGAPTGDCPGGPPPRVPDSPCTRAQSDGARLTCIPNEPASGRLGSASGSTVADTGKGALVGPRYMVGLGVAHAFALSSTLLIADVVVERFVDLYDTSDVLAELGLRRQLSPQVVADIGVTRHFAGPLKASSITLGLSFDMPLQHVLGIGR